MSPKERCFPTFIALACLASAACNPVSSSVLRTGTTMSSYAGPVRLAATWVPQGARELGLVQASGTGVQVEEIAPEFLRRVAELGGDFGKVDRISTRFELRTTTTQQSYNCGSPQHPQTCTRSVTQTVEVPITTVDGRAFTTRDAPPSATGRAPPPGADSGPPPAANGPPSSTPFAEPIPVPPPGGPQ